MAKKARPAGHSQFGIGEDVPNRTAISFIRQTITPNNSPVQLQALDVPDGFSLLVKARKTNSGIIKVGASSAEISAGNYLELNPNESIPLRVDNASNVYVDATADTDVVEYGCEQ